MSAILTLHGLLFNSNPQWVEEVEQDFDDPLIRDQVKIKWHNGIAGEVGLARSKSFEGTDTPFIGWIDPDDRYPNLWALDEILWELEYSWRRETIWLAGTSYSRVNEDLTRTFATDHTEGSMFRLFGNVLHMHGLTIARTEDVLAVKHLIEDVMSCSEWALMMAVVIRRLLEGKPVPEVLNETTWQYEDRLDEVVYKEMEVSRLWRQYDDQAHRTLNFKGIPPKTAAMRLFDEYNNGAEMRREFEQLLRNSTGSCCGRVYSAPRKPPPLSSSPVPVF